MRFLLDENLPRSAARVLRDAGHEVVAVVESPLRGKKDPELLRACNEDGRIFVTLDVGIRLPPPAQRFMSERAGSTVVEAAGSHAIYVSQPKAVAELIERAAKGVKVAAN